MTHKNEFIPANEHYYVYVHQHPILKSILAFFYYIFLLFLDDDPVMAYAHAERDEVISILRCRKVHSRNGLHISNAMKRDL